MPKTPSVRPVCQQDPRLPAFNPTTSQSLADRVRALECSGYIESYVEFCKAAGVTFNSVNAKHGYQQKLSRWINNAREEWESFGKQNYINLSSYLIEKFPFFESYMGIPIMSLLEAPMYHAIASLLNCQKRGEARDLVIRKMCGRYTVYRPSMRKFEHGFIGLMEIKYDEAADSIATRELYKKSDESMWDLPGTIYPISDDAFMILTADTTDSTIKLHYVNERGFDRAGKVGYFTGWSADTDRRRYFTTPFYARRIGDGETIELEYKDIKEFPAHIIEYLGRKLSSETPYGRFVHTPI